MAETLTTNYSWTMPDPGASANTWGSTLNATTAKIDAQVFTNAKAGIPIGSGALWFSATPPVNWLICAGQSLDTTAYAALFAVIGYTYGGGGASFNLPNFSGRMPLSTTLAAAGGEASHTLTAAEMPVHAHGVSDPTHAHNVSDAGHLHGVPDPGHTHGASQDAHTHGGVFTSTTPSGGSFYPGAGGINILSGRTDNQQPAVHINAAGTGQNATDTRGTGIGIVAAATGIGIQNNGGGAAHNNWPPYLGVNFIIKYL